MLVSAAVSLLLACGSDRRLCIDGDCLERPSGVESGGWEVMKQRHRTRHTYRLLPDTHRITLWLASRLRHLLRTGDRDFAPIDLHLIRSDRPLAFVEPGDHIYISTGLLVRYVRSCGELVAVLAHEAGHWRLDHDTDAWPDRRDEYDADERGVSLMYWAGVSPENLVTFLTRNARRARVQACPDAFNGAHPPTRRRIRYVRAQIDRMRRQDPEQPLTPDCGPALEAEFEQIQRQLHFGPDRPDAD